MVEKVNHISWRKEGSVGVLTIENPPENYIAEPEFLPLSCLSDWTSDTELKGILIQGEGRHFSAGGDLNHLLRISSSVQDIVQRMNAGKETLKYLRSLHLPLVAAIKGVCFGGGLEIALACHIRFCSDNALFAFPETGNNVIPGYGGGYFSSRAVGMQKAISLILSGEVITSVEALRIGLVDRIFSKEEVFARAMTLLHRMTHDRPRDVIMSVLETMENYDQLPFDEASRRETELFAKLAYKEAFLRGLADNK